MYSITIGNEEVLCSSHIIDKLESILVTYALTHDLRISSKFNDIILEVNVADGSKYRLKIRRFKNNAIKEIIFVEIHPTASKNNISKVGNNFSSMISMLDIFVDKLNNN